MQVATDAAQQYLETQVKTATKEQLLLMLFDGAIRFTEQARPKVEGKDLEGMHFLLVKAQRIVLELLSALDKSIGAELYNNLTGLYTFVYGRLVEANLQKKVGLLDEALRILRTMRTTWAEAIEKAQKGPGMKREAVAAVPGSGTKGGQLSVEG